MLLLIHAILCSWYKTRGFICREHSLRGTKLIWYVTYKTHNHILIYYVLKLNRFARAGKLCLSPCDVFQKINCIYRSLWTVSLLVLLNPLQSLKQLLFSLSEAVEYITKWADMCGITFLMLRVCFRVQNLSRITPSSSWHLSFNYEKLSCFKKDLLTPFALTSGFSGWKESKKVNRVTSGVLFHRFVVKVCVFDVHFS